MNQSRKKSSTARVTSQPKNATPLNKKNTVSGKTVEEETFPAETEQGESMWAHVNALKQYLDEVGQYPLLTIEQEQALARRMRTGDAEAYRQFVEANLRLVVNIAKHYNGPEMPLLDRIQEGNLGLMHAAMKFDPDLGIHFSTYATYWIRQSIQRTVLAKTRLIALPIRTGEQIVKMNRFHGQFLQTHGYEPSHEEISQALGLPEVQVVDLQQAAEWPLSLDIAVDEEKSWVDLLESPAFPNTSHTVGYEGLVEYLQPALECLSRQEREVLELRYGLGDGRTLSFNDLCFHFGRTRVGVHLLEQRALQKLKKILLSQSPGVHHLFQ